MQLPALEIFADIIEAESFPKNNVGKTQSII